ncbi:MAG: penicillin-binding transpeptidase domain-containing protein [Christensenellales bacterium]|jgi:cell division protein FtsI/penicillin-binding protein 2
MARRHCKWALLTALVMLVTLLAGCRKQPQDPAIAAERYLYLWQQQQWSQLYDLVDADTKSATGRLDFQARYRNIYRALAISEITYAAGAPVATDAGYSVPATITLHSNYLDEDTFSYTLPLIEQDGEWTVQWSESLIFPDMSAGDTVKVTNIAPTRGEIFASDGTILAKNDYNTVVYVDTLLVGEEDRPALAEQIAPLVNMTVEEVSACFTSQQAIRDQYAVVATLPPGTLEADRREQLEGMSGVKVNDTSMSPVRVYPEGSLLSHVLGYTGAITAEELEADATGRYNEASRIGRSGLEASYEQALGGEPGFRIEIRDEQGASKQVLAEKPVTNGKDLILTIDINLQRRAETILEKYINENQTCSIVVQDPTSGAVRAMASNPTFYPGNFSYPLDEALWDRLSGENSGQPLLNRACNGQYPPGSIIKPLMGGMGLETGTVTVDTPFPGTIKDNRWYPGTSWKYGMITRYKSYDGPVNMPNAIMYSDNIYFAWMGLQAGAENMMNYLTKWGVGESLPFDIPVSRSRVSTSGNLDNEGLLADTAYGQGEFTVTPLHLSVMFSCLDNQGDAMKPYVVEKICRVENGRQVPETVVEPEVYKHMLESGTVPTLRAMLRSVMTSGTGQSVQRDNQPLMGKTGTAQIGGVDAREINWFVGFYAEPGDEGHRQVTVMVDGPNYKQDNKFTMARYMFNDDPLADITFSTDMASSNEVDVDNTPAGSTPPSATASPSPNP